MYFLPSKTICKPKCLSRKCGEMSTGGQEAGTATPAMAAGKDVLRGIKLHFYPVAQLGPNLLYGSD